MRRVVGKKVEPLDDAELAGLRERFEPGLLDVGTGDGRFVYRHATEYPEALAIGLDPVAETLREVSHKASRKPARGGRPNALFLAGSAEDLPGALAGCVDLVTVNFPWGSLLRAMVEPEPEILRRLVAAARPGARFIIQINVSVFAKDDYRRRLALPPLDEERLREVVLPAYEAAGIHVERAEHLAGDVPYRSSWGQRLVRGSARRSLLLEGRCGAEPGE